MENINDPHNEWGHWGRKTSAIEKRSNAITKRNHNK